MDSSELRLHRIGIPLCSMLASAATLVACGGDLKRRDRSLVPNDDSLLASVEGLAPEDRSLAGIAYWLKCEGKVDIQGELVPTTDFVRFGHAQIEDGTRCALEIHGDVPTEARIEWLSSPVTPGLYYASESGEVRANRLSLKLYKVHRKIDEPTSELLLETMDGGECSQFDLATKLCAPDDGGDHDDDRPIERIILDMTFKVEAEALIVTTVRDGSLAAQAGIKVNDTIVTVEATPVANVDEFEAAVKAARETAGKETLLLNVIRGDEALALTLDLKSEG